MASVGGEKLPVSGKKPTTVGREADMVQQDPVAAQHELMITEIESSDGHLGTTLRTVDICEGDEPQKFMERLDNRIKSHDKEIERMCNYHYQGFIESVRGLLQVRSDVEKLKSEIQETNERLQSSGQSLMSKAEELVRCRKIQNNIEAAMDTMTMCLPVLETYGKLREQMKSKRYYPALKTLEQLEHTYLPRVSKYRFSQAMCETIPKLRDSIKDASMSDLKDFLENIRKHSERIGEISMKHAAEQHGMDPTLAKKRIKKQKRKAPPPPNPFTGVVERVGKKRQAPPPPNPFTGEIDALEDGASEGEGVKEEGDDEEEEEEEEETAQPHFGDEEMDEGLSAQDLIDFSPVYRCQHIYTVLGARETFESYYRKQRRKQARLALDPPFAMDRARRLVQATGRDPAIHDTLDGYKKYFHDIVGFFVVEEYILSTTTGLINRSYMDELWDMALNKIVAILRTHTGFCTDPTLMLQIKNLIMLFSHTLRGYGLTVSQLYDLLLEVRDQYSEILMKRWVTIFNNIFDEDNYTPMMAETLEEYEKVTNIYPFSDPKLEQEPFPKRFPFSHFVPRIYCQVKEYIYACLKFSEDLHLSFTEKENMVYKFANSFISETLRVCLSELIHKKNLTMFQLIQISINMNYLEKSCGCLEDFISNITGADKDSVHVSRLQGTAMFKDARSEAEEQIYKQINEKIDEFFDLASYDWMMTESKGHASEYITDLIAFLQSTFLSFTNLPETVAQTACMSACKHIAQVMTDFLTDTEVKSVSIGALQQFNLDLLQCEHFAESEPVAGLNQGTLQMAFIELRQLLNLFISWDWTNFFADYRKSQSKYIRVNPSTCIILLEKMKDADKKKNNLFMTFKKNERDKKKLLDTVLKQLRQLLVPVNGQPQSVA